MLSFIKKLPKDFPEWLAFTFSVESICNVFPPHSYQCLELSLFFTSAILTDVSGKDFEHFPYVWPPCVSIFFGELSVCTFVSISLLVNSFYFLFSLPEF